MEPDFARYDALIMDWDGTLVDSQPLNFRSLAIALEPHGVALDQLWYRARLGASGDDLLTQLGVTAPFDDILTHCGELIIRDIHSLAQFSTVVQWVHQGRELGLCCAVASGGGDEVVRAGLAATGLEPLFDTIVTRRDAVHGKPAPDLFLTAAERLGVAPSRCLVVEDADEGHAAARAAGMDAIDVRPLTTSSW
ncbi:HAD family hydrolase [Streptomyces sp. NPDC017991]|uniref:HAD family hydrolase n=1 Tax=Streptomyces sp. NPDC017991 TaxID=3365026 RepID=UPI0037B85022